MAQTIIVDTTPGYRMPTIYYSQGDIGRTFSIDLQSRFGESLPASPTITIQATKPSGLGFSVGSTSVSGAVVTFTVTETMSNEAGRFPAELKIVKNSVTLFTANFYIDCEANAHPEGTTDGDIDHIMPKFMSVTATTLPAGDSATYSFDANTNTATFGIPKGADGSLASQVLAADYSSSKTYAVGDYVYYSGNLYRCTTAITTAEAWTSGHWTQVALANDVSDVKSDINQLINYGYCKSIPIKLESGTISSSGQDSSNSAVCRTNGYIESDEPILFVRKAPSMMGVYKYKSDGTYVTRMWFSAEQTTMLITDVSGFKYRFIFANDPQETITDSVLSKYKGWLFALTGESDTITDIYNKLGVAETSIQSINNRLEIPINYGFKNYIPVDWSVGWISSSTGEVTTGESAIINVTPITLVGDIVIRKIKPNSILQIYEYADGSFTRKSADEGVYEYHFTADGDATYRFCYYRTNPYETATVEEFIKDFNISYSTDEIIAPKRFSAVSGKKWVTLGDSLTDDVTLSVYSGEETKNYTEIVSERLGLTLANEGVSGSGYWRKSTVSPYKGFYQVAQTIPTDADIVTLFGSFNDMGRDGDISGRHILGTIYDETTDTVGGCINQAFKNLFERVPNAVIGVILPTPWHDMTKTEAELVVYEPYVNLVKGVAERYSLPVLDLFHHSNLRPWDDDFCDSYYCNADGVHPNHYGHERIAGYIADFVESLAKLN